MCGILCYYNKHHTSLSINFKLNLEKLNNRGPDNSADLEIDNVLLGFTRLAINGLNEKSMQPFNLDDNLFCICNGEIYNYKELAYEYNIKLSTGSDCEIILPLYKKFGIKKLCELLDGVFAFVIYNKNNSTVYAGRDPYGVRPLFIGLTPENNIMLGSEIKSLYNDCIEIKAFTPGTFMNLNYFEYESYLYNNLPSPIEYNMDTILNGTNKYLKEAVNKRMMADVEIGCLLSGGVDSSLICALVSKHYNYKKLHTFSIGLKNSPDLMYAKKVSDYLGTNHHEIILTEEDVLNSIEEVIYALESYDVTTVRASIGNYLIGKYIKKNTFCKVIFNGDGADEIFGSYKWLSKITDPDEFYEENNKLLKEIYFFDVLRSDRSMAANGLEARTPFLDKKFVSFIMSILPSKKMHNNSIEKEILRNAFDKEKLLPDDVLWRSKTAFSDGITSEVRSVFTILEEYIDTQITDNEYWLFHNKYKCISKEHYYYIKIFNKLFPNTSCNNLGVIPHLWMPPKKYLGNKIDPSARLL